MKILYSFILVAFIALIFNTKLIAWFNQSEQVHGDKETIVLLHGLGRNSNSMWLLASRLEEAGYYVQNVEYSSLDQKPEEIITDISAQINQCCKANKHDVHFVGHSLGGLVIRAYLQQNKIDNLGKVVLIGTPNKGSEMVDHFSNTWLMELLGPTAQSLGTDQNSFPKLLAPPYYSLGVIAGEHKSQLNDKLIPGKDDGLVSVESAKVEGMTDFIIIETGHSRMRYNSDVAEQIVEFIKNGSFSSKT